MTRLSDSDINMRITTLALEKISINTRYTWYSVILLMIIIILIYFHYRCYYIETNKSLEVEV